VKHKENRYGLLEMLAQYLIEMVEDTMKQGRNVCIALYFYCICQNFAYVSGASD
jgi:hypothetical protein